MSNVIPFRAPRYVEIRVGRNAGVSKRRFFVMVTDIDLHEEIIYDCSQYALALSAAADWTAKGYHLRDHYDQGARP